MTYEIMINENKSAILTKCQAHVKHCEEGNHYIKFVRNYRVIAVYKLSEIIGFTEL